MKQCVANSPPLNTLPVTLLRLVLFWFWSLLVSLVFEVVSRDDCYARLAHVHVIWEPLWRRAGDFLKVCGLVVDCTHSRKYLLRYGR